MSSWNEERPAANVPSRLAPAKPPVDSRAHHAHARQLHVKIHRYHADDQRRLPAVRRGTEGARRHRPSLRGTEDQSRNDLPVFGISAPPPALAGRATSCSIRSKPVPANARSRKRRRTTSISPCRSTSPRRPMRCSRVPATWSSPACAAPEAKGPEGRQKLAGGGAQRNPRTGSHTHSSPGRGVRNFRCCPDSRASVAPAGALTDCWTVSGGSARSSLHPRLISLAPRGAALMSAPKPTPSASPPAPCSRNCPAN